MKYMLMFVSDTALEREWYENASPEQKKQGYEAIMKWWGEHSAAGRIVGGEELKPVATATTVRRKTDRIEITDGPFIESKETLGGYAIVDVPDLDAAIELARTWPALQTVEIRPIVESRDENSVPRDT